MGLKTIFIVLLIAATGGIAFSQFSVSFKADKEKGCDSLTVQFSDQTVDINPVLTWHWEFGDNTVDSVKNPVHTYSQAGIYTVKLTVTKNSGTVTKTKTDFIKVYESPVADFSASDSVFNTSFSVLFASFSNLDTAGYVYKWYFGDNDSSSTSRVIHNYRAAGTYSVFHQVTSNFGCSNDTTKEIIVSSKFSVPNVFTPNGDGVNDEFIIKTNGNATFIFKVFDRWGNLLYSDVAPSIRWDGRSLAGTPLIAGTYFYVLTSKEDETHSKQTGFIELVR